MTAPQNSSPSNQTKDRPHIFTVSEITAAVRGVLEDVFDAVWIEGEISNLRVPASGHNYFVLKDDKAQVRCVMFRNYRSGLRFAPTDGDQVLLFGRVSVYEARGEYQVIVETMEPRGLGALQKAFEQLKAKLDKEGLFKKDAKKPIPEFPWKVGIITSETGAAVRDILNVMQRRNPKVSVLLHPVKVQGSGAAEEITQAIEAMNHRKDVDALIVGRGGGSIEDLWAFNEEVVARAIYKSKVPVISAVGHEIDFTIADFVADLRAPTPSAAAELAVPVLEDITNQIIDLVQRLIGSQAEMIGDHKTRLKSLIDRRFFREPGQILEVPAQRLDDLVQRLFRGLDQWVMVQRQKLRAEVQKLFLASPQKEIKNLEEKRQRLHHMLLLEMQSLVNLEKKRFEGVINNLNALSPLAILDRGYSITTSSQTGRAVKSSGEVNEGDQVRVRLAKGKLDCTVDKKIE